MFDTVLQLYSRRQVVTRKDYSISTFLTVIRTLFVLKEPRSGLNGKTKTCGGGIRVNL